jgi:hypothetical protein
MPTTTQKFALIPLTFARAPARGRTLDRAMRDARNGAALRDGCASLMAERAH